MDQYSRRIIGFAVQPIAVDGPSLCRMFNQIIAGIPLPRRLSSDNDPLFEFYRWQANLRVLDIDPILSVHSVPVSQPFIERVIQTIRREYLDHLFYWNSDDLLKKLDLFKAYFNGARVHQGIDGDLPDHKSGELESTVVNVEDYTWKSHCNGLFVMPQAA